MSFTRWLVEFVLLLIIAWVVAIGIKTWVLQPFIIPSESMEPTLLVNDRVLVLKFQYRFDDPRQGDIVVFGSPDGITTDYIKRIIAVGGQTVDIQSGMVYVDGQKLQEPYLDPLVRDDYSAKRKVTVPAGSVYLMGDNRPNSRDSRYFGPQPIRRILGRAFVIYWPLERIRPL